MYFDFITLLPIDKRGIISSFSGFDFNFRLPAKEEVALSNVVELLPMLEEGGTSSSS